MSASADLQKAVTNLLSGSRYWLEAGAPATAPHLRVKVAVVPFRSKDQAVAIEAAAAAREIGIHVQAPLPTRALQGVPFVFIEASELRITIVEQPQINTLRADAYDLLDDVLTALQWQPHRGIEEAVAATRVAHDCDAAAALARVQADAAFAPLFALAALVAHPIQVAPRPSEMIWDPTTRMQGLAADARMLDAIFNVTHQLNPTRS